MNVNFQSIIFSWKEIFIDIYFHLRMKIMSVLGNASSHFNQFSHGHLLLLQ